jgi:selenocysteine lyase/cysteine desulfurase
MTVPIQSLRRTVPTKQLLQVASRCCASTTSKKDGYQSIGSFHTDNPEELIRLPDHEYVMPGLPFPSEQTEILPTLSYAQDPFANASQYQKVYPHLDRSNWTFLNHGAFGLAILCGIERANSWRYFLESQPLRYFDRYLLDHLVHSARCMVDFCSNASDKDSKLRLRESVALIPNVTSGMNTVLAGHARCNKNKVFYFDIGYGSNKKMCQTYHGSDAVVIPFDDEFLPQLQPISSRRRQDNDENEAAAEVFIKALDATVQHEISSGSTSKESLQGSLLILDHITSNTAIHTPITTIAKHAKEEYGMLSVVDGAHGLLGLDLDMCKILSSGACNDTCFNGYVDIYITNAHKWFSSPRGAAVMFCANPSIRETILRQPAVVSHGVDDGYLSRFLWDGCRGYAAQLSLPVIATYWNSTGANNTRREMERNLLEGVRILVTKWHPEVCADMGNDFLKHTAEARLTLVPLGAHAPMMALVQLPLEISGGSKLDCRQMTSTDAKRVQDFLFSQNVEVPVKCVQGVLYVRVSCHLYNTAEEFDSLAIAMLRCK